MIFFLFFILNQIFGYTNVLESNNYSIIIKNIENNLLTRTANIIALLIKKNN